ncbi:MAG: serine kinase, partial [Nitrospirota bacterium]
MKLRDVVESLSLEVKTGKANLDNIVTGVYISDLLSDVMGNSKEGNIWITLQTHLNIVAVA